MKSDSENKQAPPTTEVPPQYQTRQAASATSAHVSVSYKNPIIDVTKNTNIKTTDQQNHKNKKNREILLAKQTMGLFVKNPLLDTKLVKPQLAPVKRLLLGPGPQNAHPRVHAAMALQQVGHLDADFMRIVEDIKHMLRYMWQTQNLFTVPVSGTGCAAWEAGVANCTEFGDTHLICVNGYFGERAVDMHGRYTDKIERIDKPYGEVFTVEEVAAGLEKYKPQLLWICHAETSTGTLQPNVGEIGELCRKHDCLLMLDTVTSICGVPIHLDDWKVDICYAGGQKCMGCPPGIAPLTLGERALKKLDSRKDKVKNWYLDMSMIKKYMVVEGNAPRVYHHTAPITMAYAMREALTLVAEEGLENSHARHLANAQYFWAELKKIGCEPYVDEKIRLPSLTTIKIPDGCGDGMKVIALMRDRFDIEIGAALGSLKGKCWRIGLMGYNSNKMNVKTVTAALAECIEAVKNPSSSL
ncbi:unnamed protein product [Amoebophrya sp. A120]|nr:unnamed protein product [Amoebophrya sp. A120]|eukprot:GSA120T00014198001.1